MATEVEKPAKHRKPNSGRIRHIRRRLQQPIPVTRIARGVAAGFVVAAVPLPGLQIPMALLLAWLTRGNLVASIFPQFLSNASTLVPQVAMEFSLGAAFWPGAQQHELGVLLQTVGTWSWTTPGTTLSGVWSALVALGAGALGPLVIGVVLSGGLAAAMSYVATVVLVQNYRAWRRRHEPRTPLIPRPLRIPDDLAPLAPNKVIARYFPRRARFDEADVRLLFDGRQAFPEMLAAIAAAGHSVDLETYILVHDQCGRRFQRALIDAAARGVRVRLLYDWWGCRSLSQEYVRELVACGVEVATYHPLIILRPKWALNRRNHRKIMIVDGHVGFTGGLNIADDYAAPEDGGKGWRDTHVRLDGAAAAGRLASIFEHDWRHSTPFQSSGTPGQRLRDAVRRRLRQALEHKRPAGGWGRLTGAPRGGASPVQIVANQEFRYRRRIDRAYRYAIRHAREYILISNAYFVPGRAVQRALARAARRGVRVGIVVAEPRVNDLPYVGWASRAMYGDLLAAGVRIYEWPLGMMHAKTAVIDDAWAVVGSYNLDHGSLLRLLEAVAVIADPAVARQLRRQTLADIARCREVTIESHEARPWHDILLDSLAYAFRGWM